MAPPPTMFLSGLTYLEEKRQIAAEFSGNGQAACFRYPFFPKAHFYSKQGSEAFGRELSKAGHRGLRLEAVANGIVSVASQDFATLEQASRATSEAQGMQYRLLPPERQFLLERGWSLFGAFALGDDEPVPLASAEFPDVRLSFLSGTLSENLSSLSHTNPGLALETACKVALSRILSTPIAELSRDTDPSRVFLENVSFLSGRPLAGNHACPAHHEAPLPSHGIDFSGMLSLVAARKNIGFETINCRCCAPASLDSPNVLPSSMVSVRFLREGFYFNPLSASWAAAFHSSMPFAEARLSRKQEYGFTSFPAGPFSRNETFPVPLCDALQLEARGEATILDPSTLKWSCTKRESSYSKAVASLDSLLQLTTTAAEAEKNNMVASHGLLYYTTTPSHESLYRQALSMAISQILSGLPHALLGNSSGFHSAGIATALECIAGGIATEIEKAAATTGRPASTQSFCAIATDGPETSHALFRGLSSSHGLGKPYLRLLGHD